MFNLQGMPIVKSQKDINTYHLYASYMQSILQLVYLAIKSKTCTCGDIEQCIKEVVDGYNNYNKHDFVYPKYRSAFLDIHVLDENKQEIHFGRQCCISINDVVAHGRPDLSYEFKNTDIVSIDFGFQYIGSLYTKGLTNSVPTLFYDAAFTIKVGEPKDQFACFGAQVLKQLNGCRFKTVGELSKSIASHIMDGTPYIPVVSLGGHGIGRSLHELPFIPNKLPFGHEDNTPLLPGMVLCIEPIYVEASSEYETIERTHKKSHDSFAIYTTSGKPAAHWESMFIVQEDNSLYDLLQLDRILY